MPVIKTSNPALTSLIGIHLWHAGMSSCSQRVRIALAEKGQEFTGHMVNLHMGENATPEYQEIHPDGLVPAMVIDGELIVESVDMIDEIDRRYEGASLRPSDPAVVEVVEDLMASASKAQSNLKILTFEFLFSVAPAAPKEAAEAFQRDHKNEYLKQFHKDAAAGFPREKVRAAVEGVHQDFLMLNTLLSDGRKFLAGNEFTLADISWIPNFHRFDLIGWPYEKYPELQEWFKRVSSRDSYQQGLVEWEPQELVQLVSPKIAARRADGDGVDSYLAQVA